MKVEIRVTKNFKKEAKPLLKKYSSLHSELNKLEEELTSTPKMGIPLGNNTYKIRLSIKSKSKGKGKSGGARVITLVESELIGIVEHTDELVIISLLTIYDKSETESISYKELRELIKNSDLS
ncbi:hypothetical protein [Pontibacter beigongshangensis]|uniref:hypothetical protein n=1 Tax=Pontibacter beigongshangensis TaxID=2574733 RepID=UPI00164FF4FC|nr:hypothetical protein [Pontibacter beigongshangensis]